MNSLRKNFKSSAIATLWLSLNGLILLYFLRYGFGDYSQDPENPTYPPIAHVFTGLINKLDIGIGSITQNTLLVAILAIIAVFISLWLLLSLLDLLLIRFGNSELPSTFTLITTNIRYFYSGGLLLSLIIAAFMVSIIDDWLNEFVALLPFLLAYFFHLRALSKDFLSCRKHIFNRIPLKLTSSLIFSLTFVLIFLLDGFIEHIYPENIPLALSLLLSFLIYIFLLILKFIMLEALITKSPLITYKNILVQRLNLKFIVSTVIYDIKLLFWAGVILAPILAMSIFSIYIVPVLSQTNNSFLFELYIELSRLTLVHGIFFTLLAWYFLYLFYSQIIMAYRNSEVTND